MISLAKRYAKHPLGSVIAGQVAIPKIGTGVVPCGFMWPLALRNLYFVLFLCGYSFPDTQL